MKLRPIPILVIAAAAFAVSSPGALRADDHIVTEMSRTYMGQVSPPRATETWVCDTAAVYRDRGLTTITRFDLKKRWTILDRNKKYFEESLEPQAHKTPTVRAQELGFDYEPVYTWKVVETGETRDIMGRTCRKVVAIGDADYAEETREMWVAVEASIDLKRYHARITDSDSDPAWTELVRQSPLLKAGIVLESKHVQTPPIAPEMTWVFRVTKLEAGVAPPPGLYEIPAGFTKAASLDELFAR
jgi:hypothetical protein